MKQISSSADEQNWPYWEQLTGLWGYLDQSHNSNKRALGRRYEYYSFVFLLLFWSHSLEAALGGNYVTIKATWKPNMSKHWGRRGQTYSDKCPWVHNSNLKRYPLLAHLRKTDLAKLARQFLGSGTRIPHYCCPWANVKNMQYIFNACTFLLSVSPSIWPAEPIHTSVESFGQRSTVG